VGTIVEGRNPNLLTDVHGIPTAGELLVEVVASLGAPAADGDRRSAPPGAGRYCSSDPTVAKGEPERCSSSSQSSSRSSSTR